MKLVKLQIVAKNLSQYQAQLIWNEMFRKIVSKYALYERRSFNKYPVPVTSIVRDMKCTRSGNFWCIGIPSGTETAKLVEDIEFGVLNRERLIRPVLEGMVHSNGR